MEELTYDRAKAVAYAERWALSRNPRYYDFEDIGGDCTNFASQCIYAGAGVMNWTPVTGGALGISDIPPFQIFGFTADGEIAKFFVIFIVCLLVNVVIRVLFHSPLGRSFMAIRDNELAADCLGVNSLLAKSTAFAISGALCGAAGALYAFLSGYLSYQTFTYQQSTMYLIMIMLGGTISPVGAIIGTLCISLLQEWVRPLQNYMQFIYGIGIMILMVVQPEGILGGGKTLYEKYIKPKKRSSEAG